MRKIVFLLSLMVLLVVGCSDKSDSKPLVVGMELQYPPFEMSDTQGNPTGFSVDMAHDLGDYLGREVVIENTAWTGLIPSLQTGKIDLIISSMAITEERAEVVDFSDPYLQSGLALLIAKSSPVEGYQDLNRADVEIAVKAGTIGEFIAKEQFPEATIRVFQQVAPAVLEVSQGRLDAFLYDPLTIYENYKNHPDTTRYNMEPIPGSYGDWGVAIKQGNQSLLDEVNEFIAHYYKSGGFEKLTETYLSDIAKVFAAEGVPFFFD